MKTNEEFAGILNDLIIINNDRVVGYKRAAEHIIDDDADLASIFTRMADDSRRYVLQLSQIVRNLGEEPADGTTTSGKLYRAWMDVKNAITSKDRHSILESCEFGEDAAQKAYNAALTSDTDLPADIHQLISDQKFSLKESHDLVKEYRDQYETSR